MKRILLIVVVLLCGPLAGSAAAHHATDAPPELTPAVSRALGPGTSQTEAGLFRVPLASGGAVRTHGPDLAPTAADNFTAGLEAAGSDDRFLSGAAERAPICATDNSMQVLYARQATTPDAFAASVPAIRTTVRRSNNVLNEDAITSGGGGADYKVICASGGVIDVKSFITASTSFSGVVSSAQAAGYTASNRNYAIFLDAGGGNTCGVGSLYDDNSPGLGNLHNTQGGYAVIYRGCWTGVTFMHEVGHNRGAVQEQAPHSTGDGFHCNDGHDVMCYAPDGGDRNQTMIQPYPCPTVTYFDCGFDTYFDAAPEAGEFLANHWNLGRQGQNFLRVTAAGAPNQPPVAGFSYDCDALACDFTDSSTDDSSIVSRSWAFGDGQTSTAVDPSHTYADPGTYSVTLTVTDDDGVSDGQMTQVAVSEEPDPPDEVAPNTSISEAPAKKTRIKRALFEFAGSDETTASENLVYECALDDKAFKPCGSPKAYSSIKPGRHRFQVRAVDEAQNADSSPASHSWKVAKPRRKR